MRIRGLLFTITTLLLSSCPIFLYAAAPDSVGSGFKFPLGDPGALTSTFSEYRSGHFHAGIDLSTHGKVGMPVIAVRSGYVYRVRVSGGGYGKALELLLDNGMLAVYAHLEGFSEKIEAFARAKQLERENYEIDAFPAPFQIPVSAGEIIAYSGNTGFSFGPHLHFELRRGDVALNPLSSVFSLEERVPPTFRFVKLTPVGPGSEVDGQNSPRVLYLRGSHEHGTYSASSVPEMEGEFFVSISVFDRTEKASNRLSVYELKLFLDDSLLFGSRFDRIESSRTHEVELAYDHGLARKGEVYTFNLCRFVGSRLALLKGLKPGAGVFNTDSLGLSGEHTLRIQASDARGNTSTALVRFVANRRPRVASVALNRRESSLLVIAEVEDPGDVSSVWMDYVVGALSGNFARVALTKKDEAGFRASGGSYSAELELPPSLATTETGGLKGIFRVWARDSGGALSRPFTKTLLGGDTLHNVSADLSIERKRDYAEITARVSHDFLRPAIGIVDGDTLWLDVTEESDGRCVARYEFDPMLSDASTAICVVEAGNSRPFTASRPLGVHIVKKGWEGSVWSSDGLAGFFYRPETFYQNVYISIISIERKDREPLAQGLRFASDTFSFVPSDVVFDKAGIVVIRCDSDVPVADRVGLYRKDLGKKWSYVGAVVDTVNRTAGARVRSFSRFALIKDEIPPSVSGVRPRKGRVCSSGTPPTYAIVRDVGSGLGWQGMKVSIDGKLVLSEWDPRVSRLSVVYNEPLSKGKHSVVFEINDKAGNKTLAETEFRVVR